MNRRNFFKTALGAIGAAAIAKVLPATAAAAEPTAIGWQSNMLIQRPVSNAFISNICSTDIVCSNGDGTGDVYSGDMSTFKTRIRVPDLEGGSRPSAGEYQFSARSEGDIVTIESIPR